MADIRIALVDGHVMMREALAAQLDQVEGVRVVWQGIDETDLLTYYASEAGVRPQVVVMAVWLRGKVGVTATKRLKKLSDQVRVIGLTMNQDMEVIRRMMEAGAYGCVHKADELSALVEMIQAAWRGTDPVDPSTRAALDAYLERLHNWPTESGFPITDGTNLVALTPRELEVLNYICRAFDNRTIGKQMGISARTVQAHLTHVYEKMQVRGRMEAIIVAIRDRWISPDFLD